MIDDCTVYVSFAMAKYLDASQACPNRKDHFFFGMQLELSIAAQWTLENLQRGVSSEAAVP